MQETRRSILRKLSSQHNHSNTATESSLPAGSQVEGDTERFDRVLALWLDLQNAIQALGEHVKRESGCTPWTCPDHRVRDAWQNLTNPQNSLALEQLFLQLGEGRQLEMVRHALQVCRSRCKET
jgi:hypothetical protein